MGIGSMGRVIQLVVIFIALTSMVTIMAVEDGVTGIDQVIDGSLSGGIISEKTVGARNLPQATRHDDKLGEAATWGDSRSQVNPVVQVVKLLKEKDVKIATRNRYIHHGLVGPA